MPESVIPICDLHCDTATNLLIGDSLLDPRLQVNLPAMKKAGIGLQVFACYLPPAIPKGKAFAMISDFIARFKEVLTRHEEDLQLCLDREQVMACQKQGKIAALLAVENGNAIEADLGKLEALYRMGVRLMTIVHAESNEWVISSNDARPPFPGLSDFGREVIQAMNDLGMIIDLSHAHDRAVEAVLRISKHPVIASHSCARALCDTARNLPDDLIAGIAAGDGLIGLNIYPGFLDGAFNRLIAEQAGDLFTELGRLERSAGMDLARIGRLFPDFSAKFQTAMAGHSIPLERYYDHILYLSELVGAEFIAFGSDFDGVPLLPQGVKDCSVFGDIRAGLFERDYSRDEVEAICWNNFMRVLGAVCG